MNVAGGRYASDMADREWALIAPFMPPHKTTWADVAACLVFAGLSQRTIFSTPFRHGFTLPVTVPNGT